MIERIPSYYASFECAQLTIPFYSKITMFDDNIYSDGILCHYDFTDDSQNINKYLTDNRRDVFPYSDIPMYKGLFCRYYVNMLLEYNKHYITISDGIIRDRYVVRDGDTAIALTRVLTVPFNVKGNIYSFDEIKDKIKVFGDYVIFDRFGRKFKDTDSFINNGGGILIFRDNGFRIRLIKINRDIGFDSYMYKEFDLSLNNYTVEELKYFSSKIKEYKKVCIYSCVNPNIDRRVISENKRLVRKLSK